MNDNGSAKKKPNHVRNLSYGIGASVLIAFVVAAANPINGWVFSLITIIIVTLPLTLITVIVQNVQSRRMRAAIVESAKNIQEEDTRQDAANAAKTDINVVDSAVDLPTAPEYRLMGRVHLGIGIGVLGLAIGNLIWAQTMPLWTKMFVEPFWWIIALCSSVSFLLANTNFNKAKAHEAGQTKTSV